VLGSQRLALDYEHVIAAHHPEELRVDILVPFWCLHLGNRYDSSILISDITKCLQMAFCEVEYVAKDKASRRSALVV
jgi:hypothetical protein